MKTFVAKHPSVPEQVLVSMTPDEAAESLEALEDLEKSLGHEVDGMAATLKAELKRALEPWRV
jgi:hypothetical protein